MGQLDVPHDGYKCANFQTIAYTRNGIKWDGGTLATDTREQDVRGNALLVAIIHEMCTSEKVVSMA